jgi:C1A family cysteine protease
MLREGNVLIGNMQITKDYFILGPNDVYDIPPDAIYETNSWGQKISHCMVIVGFGVTQDGKGYYVFQNSYGPNWGSGGYGRVSSDSLKYLYSPRLGM